MKRKEDDRSSSLLLIGSDAAHCCKIGDEAMVQSRAAKFSVTVDHAPTVEEAIEQIRLDHEVVYLGRTGKGLMETMFGSAELLADKLAAHPHKPWVVIDDDLRYLKATFTTKGLVVYFGDNVLCPILLYRWIAEKDVQEEAA